ncbi:unnamed protein product [Linum tenue]|uniref:Uncharacterized protein n=1 Tax=Linum tenue TaxID=586396 RepID=A0AAV0MLM6_9ROSI|nr:unnamed protein product [Linum tenue]
MWRSKLAACTLTGAFSLPRKSRILKPRSLRIGMRRSTFLTLRTRSQR